MATFKALIGDLFESRAQTLVNTVNCVGVMGKGVADGFKRRFPEMFEDYKRRIDQKLVRIGEPYLYVDRSGTRIMNFPTKDHWRSPSRLSYVDKGLDYLAAHAAEWGITGLAVPPLGCGNGGLDWSEVAPLIYQKLHRLPITIELYAPYGTPKNQLTERFLSAPSQMSLEGKGRKSDPLKQEWVILMEVLRELESQPYASRVGRTIFQKISYIVTEMGVPTGLSFEKGSYGPFSTDVKLVLHDFANRNWLREESLGSMIALRIAPQYQKDRSRYRATIDRYEKKIAKTADLFSRIKNTEQAEEVVTVLYASRQVKESGRSVVAEHDLCDYILEWKKAWRTDDKTQAVASAIRNLALLGWLQITLAEPVTDTAAS